MNDMNDHYDNNSFIPYPLTVKIVYHNKMPYFEFTMYNGSIYDPRCDMPGLLPHLRQKNWWTDKIEAETLKLYQAISRSFSDPWTI